MKNNIYDTLLNLYDYLDEETKKALIIYKSETGFTQKYVKWLSNELQAWDDDEGAYSYAEK